MGVMGLRMNVRTNGAQRCAERGRTCVKVHRLGTLTPPCCLPRNSILHFLPPLRVRLLAEVDAPRSTSGTA
eukprot:1113214-Rhodomonas_salina.1